MCEGFEESFCLWDSVAGKRRQMEPRAGGVIACTLFLLRRCARVPSPAAVVPPLPAAAPPPHRLETRSRGWMFIACSSCSSSLYAYGTWTETRLRLDSQK